MDSIKQNKLYIVMMGLPARGKSTIARRLKENLQISGLKAEIFNNGDLRRKLIKENTSFANFYDPNNKEGTALREKIARMNLENAREYILNSGQVAILDATHVSRKRRELVSSMLNQHPILYLECINPDQDIMEASIAKKASLPEFSKLSHKEAVKSFKQRIAYYEHIYSPFENERNFLKIDSLNNHVLESRITDSIPFFEQIRDVLVTDSVKNLFLIRHGETYDNLENRIGGDSHLTPKGKSQAEQLARHFQQTSLPYIFCSKKIRTIETAEPIKQSQNGNSVIITLQEFNEIDSGICEEMSYEEIRETYPEIFYSRTKDKYNYIYPQGEGYVSMRPRIDKGLKKALYLSGNSENIMIVGHRAVNRMILAHFLYRRLEDVPYIFVPQNRYYHIISTQQKKLFELKWIHA